MKKTLLWLLALLLLAASPSHAEEEELDWISPTIGSNDAVMIVDNGSDWQTRLNLRAEQRKGSEILGRIYTGTRIEVYQDNGEWCLVGLQFNGSDVLTGEVMKAYLRPVGGSFSALCPLAVVKTEVSVTGTGGFMELIQLKPGDKAYVLAVCGDEYFLMIPDVGQGYAPVSAFEPLSEPKQEERIVYQTWVVPSGGITFIDKHTQYETTLVGGVYLEDCWQVEGETQWHITYGAGIQRMLRAECTIPQDQLSQQGLQSFEGEVYAYDKSFILRVGTQNGKPILKRIEQNGDILWAVGNVPKNAVPLDPDLCIIECEATELLSQAVIDNLFAYVREKHPLDERTSSDTVSDTVIDRCKLRAALVLEPRSCDLTIHAWLEDEDGAYVTGGDLAPKSGAITRWG